jgi:hypothetical protein
MPRLGLLEDEVSLRHPDEYEKPAVTAGFLFAGA